jgi:hypothetical protein
MEVESGSQPLAMDKDSIRSVCPGSLGLDVGGIVDGGLLSEFATLTCNSHLQLQ